MICRYIEPIDELSKTQSLRVQKGDLRTAGVAGNVWDCKATGVRITHNGLAESERRA